MSKKDTKKAAKKAKPMEASVRFMKPNKLFTANLTALIRGYVYPVAVKCASCGKMKRGHWTMLCPFKGVPWPDHQVFTITTEHLPVLPAGTSVCSNCMLAPQLPPELIEGFPLKVTEIPGFPA